MFHTPAVTIKSEKIYIVHVPIESLLLSRAPLDNNLIKQLNDNPGNRYSFVCNAIMRICNCNSQHTDK